MDEHSGDGRLFFLTFLLGQSIAGMFRHNSELREHGHPEVSYIDYVATSNFLEATAETGKANSSSSSLMSY